MISSIIVTLQDTKPDAPFSPAKIPAVETRPWCWLFHALHK
jgi:hypothetical protein